MRLIQTASITTPVGATITIEVWHTARRGGEWRWLVLVGKTQLARGITRTGPVTAYGYALDALTSLGKLLRDSAADLRLNERVNVEATDAAS